MNQSLNKSANNKRIAKNTLFLNIRMVLTIIIALYTSRVVFNTLGVEDFGVYNVVGGIIAMFGFINVAMYASTQRYLTIALEQGDPDQLNRVFSTSIIIHAAISIIIIILAETIGLWFVYNKLNVAQESFTSALWAYQFSVLTIILMVMSTPYSADLVANERFNAYAFISLFESVLKLSVAFILQLDFADKLKWYGILLFAAQLLIRFMYTAYSKKHFPETKFSLVWDTRFLKEMSGFAGWTMGGTFSVLSCVQGLNIMLNVFFNPIVNAARAISVQVQNAILSFSKTIQLAFNPQIMKTFAAHDIQYMHQLIYTSTTFNFYFISLLTLPILVSTNYILHIWLGKVPEYTVVFVQIMLIIGLVNSLASPLTTAVQATGRLKRFQIWESGSLLMVLPISYILLKYELIDPIGVFVVQLIFEIITQIIRIFIVCPMINMSRRDYFRQVIFKLSQFIFLAFPIPMILSTYFDMGLKQTFFLCVVSLFFVIVSTLIVINKSERNKIKNIVLSKINKVK